MSWELTEISWYYPVTIKIFIDIFFITLVCLSYYFFSHYILATRLRKHIKFFKKLQTAKTPDTEIGIIIDQQLNKTKNPQIKDLYRSFSSLVANPTEIRENLTQKHKREIDYFLDRRKLQIKGLAIVLILSMAGLILMEIKILLTEIDFWCAYANNPKLPTVISALFMNFRYNLFYPLAIALAETFLVFWLINSVKKLRLWLDHEWANLKKETL